MIKDEEYVDLLKKMIACVSYGDYEAVKELSNLKLEEFYKKKKTEKIL